MSAPSERVHHNITTWGPGVTHYITAFFRQPFVKLLDEMTCDILELGFLQQKPIFELLEIPKEVFRYALENLRAIAKTRYHVLVGGHVDAFWCGSPLLVDVEGVGRQSTARYSFAQTP